ncbi:IS110 family transposase, partial [Belnapia sp. T18]|nr:IS110 family transposase [Belnapia arida]
VPAKTEAQQASLVELKVRDMLVRQRTQTVNALRSHLAEYGIVAAQGRKLTELIAVVRDGDDARLPHLAREALGDLV